MKSVVNLFLQLLISVMSYIIPVVSVWYVISGVCPHCQFKRGKTFGILYYFGELNTD